MYNSTNQTPHKNILTSIVLSPFVCILQTRRKTNKSGCADDLLAKLEGKEKELKVKVSMGGGLSLADELIGRKGKRDAGGEKSVATDV